MIKKTMKWPLMSGDSIDQWVSRSGKLIMLGDAAHAMVPYMSQGKLVMLLDTSLNKMPRLTIFEVLPWPSKTEPP